jgi:putative MATE family efflux protein
MNFFKNIFDAAFLKRLLPLAIPVAIHEFLMSSLDLLDTVMIGRYNESGIAAVSLANQIFLIFILILIGVTSGSNIFTAQFWGANDHKGVRKVVGIMLISSVTISLIFSIIATLFGSEIMNFYTPDKNLVKLGASYLAIAGFAYPFTAISISIGTSLRSINNARLPLVISVFSLSINAILNYILIFGNFGFPELGVRGAAIGTLISRVIEATLLILAVFHTNSPLVAVPKELFSASKEFVLKLFKTSFPVIVNELGWILGFSYYNKIYAGINSEAISAVSVVGSSSMLFMVIFFGSSSATAVIIGNSIGNENLIRAQEDAERVMGFAPIVAILTSILIYIFAPVVPLVFGLSSLLGESAVTILRIFAILFPFKMFNLHLVNGLLRSGGDTTFAMGMDIIGVWLIGVPTAIVTATYFNYPVEIVYFLVGLEDVVKAGVGYYRIKSGRWINRVV